LTWLNPALALAGIACVAIPIIIHLLMHRRRKPVMWGAMRFLQEAYRRQRRRLQMEKWLLLAVRCLLLAAIAGALGRPLLGALGGRPGGRTVFILIDTGIASGLRGPDGKTALERHREEAKAVLATLRSAASGTDGDRVALITLGGPAEGVVLPPSGNLAAVGELLDQLTPTDAKTDVSGGLALTSGALAPRGTEASPAIDASRTLVVVLSDFREGSIELRGGTTAETLAGSRLPEGVGLVLSEPAAAPAGNVSVVGVEPLRSVLIGRAGGAGEPDVVRVLLRRSGTSASEPAATTVRAELSVGDAPPEGPAPVGRAVVRWSAGQETAAAVLTLEGPGGPSRGVGAGRASSSAVVSVSIDDDALAADNRARRGIEVREALRVGLIAPPRFARSERVDTLDAASWLRLALSPQETDGPGEIDLVDIEPATVDLARLAGLDAVIVPRPDQVGEAAWARVRQFLDAGGLVLVTPPAGATVHLWADTMLQGLGASGLSVAREARAVEPTIRLSSAARGPSSDAPGDSAGAEGLLGVVAGELDELLRPVTLTKVLPFTVEPGAGEGSPVLSLDDGSVVVWAGQVAPAEKRGAGSRGLFVYMGVAPELSWGDLPARPLMVPLVQEIVRQGVGRARGAAQAAAGSRPVVPGRTVELRRVAERGATASARETRGPDVLPVDASGRVDRPVRFAGVWRALDAGGAERGVVTVNPDARGGRVGVQDRAGVGELLASAMTTTDQARAVAWLPSGDGAPPGAPGDPAGPRTVAQAMGELLDRGDRGSPIAGYLLAAALFLAVVEVFLARRASHAELTSGPARTTSTPASSGPVAGEAAA
jgi:hypothetical protein